jgi:hypothetical protein
VLTLGQNNRPTEKQLRPSTAKKPSKLMMVRPATHEPEGMVDLLDRILDKGIVIDVWARVILGGIDLGIRWEANIVIASIDTYLEHFGPIGMFDWHPPPVLKEKAGTTLKRLTKHAGR